MAEQCLPCGMQGVTTELPCRTHSIEIKTDDGLHVLATTRAGAERMVATMRARRESKPDERETDG